MDERVNLTGGDAVMRGTHVTKWSHLPASATSQRLNFLRGSREWAFAGYRRDRAGKLAKRNFGPTSGRILKRNYGMDLRADTAKQMTPVCITKTLSRSSLTSRRLEGFQAQVDATLLFGKMTKQAFE